MKLCSNEATAFVGQPDEGQEHVLNLTNIASFLEKPFFDGPVTFADELVAAAKYIEGLRAENTALSEQLDASLRDYRDLKRDRRKAPPEKTPR